MGIGVLVVGMWRHGIGRWLELVMEGSCQGLLDNWVGCVDLALWCSISIIVERATVKEYLTGTDKNYE